MIIRLREYMEAEEAWGTEEGQQAFLKLLKVIEQYPEQDIFCVSLRNIRRTDASFPRESVIRLAKSCRERHGFCILDAEDNDLLDNWDAAAIKLNQPLVAWKAHGHRLLGPPPSEGTQMLFDHVVAQGVMTTSTAAGLLGTTASNASNKLKELWRGGYLMRRERAAVSGGIEHEYFAIRE